MIAYIIAALLVVGMTLASLAAQRPRWRWASGAGAVAVEAGLVLLAIIGSNDSIGYVAWFTATAIAFALIVTSPRGYRNRRFIMGAAMAVLLILAPFVAAFIRAMGGGS
ncbi:hypothetical protein HY480_00395 [Candidatus Uhrbacteria bacterium]|nr:hypothetical protein [Candidatus Uhrbacteria bacterium]